MLTGNGADVGKVKGPILRGLAGRAPYFQNGGATTLSDVVDFYDQGFNLNSPRKAGLTWWHSYGRFRLCGYRNLQVL